MAEDDDLLLLREEKRVSTITINRPEARNALSTRMRARLCTLLEQADRDSSVKAVVLTGGPDVFSAGVDFKGMESDFDLYRDQFAVNPASAIRAMSTPVICAVSGACVSGALEIALSGSSYLRWV